MPVYYRPANVYGNRVIAGMNYGGNVAQPVAVGAGYVPPATVYPLPNNIYYGPGVPVTQQWGQASPQAATVYAGYGVQQGGQQVYNPASAPTPAPAPTRITQTAKQAAPRQITQTVKQEAPSSALPEAVAQVPYSYHNLPQPRVVEPLSYSAQQAPSSALPEAVAQVPYSYHNLPQPRVVEPLPYSAQQNRAIDWANVPQQNYYVPGPLPNHHWGSNEEPSFQLAAPQLPIYDDPRIGSDRYKLPVPRVVYPEPHPYEYQNLYQQLPTDYVVPTNPISPQTETDDEYNARMSRAALERNAQQFVNTQNAPSSVAQQNADQFAEAMLPDTSNATTYSPDTNNQENSWLQEWSNEFLRINGRMPNIAEVIKEVLRRDNEVTQGASL